MPFRFICNIGLTIILTNKNKDEKQTNKGEKTNISVRVDEEIWDEFIRDLPSNKRKGSHARDILTQYYTKYKKIDTDDNVYLPKDVLKELYNSVDDKKKSKIVDTIVTLTLDKMNVKIDDTIAGLVSSLKRWFDNNCINFEVGKDKKNNIWISSHHKWGSNFSDITVEAIKKTLQMRNHTCTVQMGRNYFKITIL